MLREQFNRLHNTGCLCIPKTLEKNNLPSYTDPTQECPVASIAFGVDGAPIGVAENKLPFNGVPLNSMTSIESRHRDKFDVYGELQSRARQIRSINGINISNSKND